MGSVKLAALLLLAGWSTVAEARPHRPPSRVRVVVPGPAVRFFIGPWVVGWRPATPRPGWIWVEGHYDAAGHWIPGYWAPAVPRPGYAWVPGHWIGEQYFDGYWREDSRPGSVWVDGYYDADGNWVPGYWAPAYSSDAHRDDPGHAPPPRDDGGEIHHDYE